MAEIRVVMSVTPEEALELAQALKTARQVQANRVLKPQKPKITVGVLADALQAVGINDAKLIEYN
jgi:hypothetical protein